MFVRMPGGLQAESVFTPKPGLLSAGARLLFAGPRIGPYRCLIRQRLQGEAFDCPAIRPYFWG